MYHIAVYNTLLSMGPYYANNVLKWFLSALWDAPRRVYLDIDLEYMKLKRDLSKQEELD